MRGPRHRSHSDPPPTRRKGWPSCSRSGLEPAEPGPPATASPTHAARHGHGPTPAPAGRGPSSLAWGSLQSLLCPRTHPAKRPARDPSAWAALCAGAATRAARPRRRPPPPRGPALEQRPAAPQCLGAPSRGPRGAGWPPGSRMISFVTDPPTLPHGDVLLGNGPCEGSLAQPTAFSALRRPARRPWSRRRVSRTARLARPCAGPGEAGLWSPTSQGRGALARSAPPPIQRDCHPYVQQGVI